MVSRAFRGDIAGARVAAQAVKGDLKEAWDDAKEGAQILGNGLKHSAQDLTENAWWSHQRVKNSIVNLWRKGNNDFMPDLKVNVSEGRRLPYLTDVSRPLTTKDQWVADKQGNRVKLGCVNWPSHLESYLPEGLADQTIAHMSEQVKLMGFNCVRYPLAVETVQNFNSTISKGLARIKPEDARAILKNHPQFDANVTTVRDVFRATMQALAAQGIMVILDNHHTEASWCCSIAPKDKNRWFSQFSVPDWLNSLHVMAEESMVEGSPIIGVGLRNEMFSYNYFTVLNEWYTNMREAARVVHDTNPELLIAVGGIEMHSNFQMLLTKPFFPRDHPIKQQVIYEAHFYNLGYVKPFWKVMGRGATCRYMHAFLDSRVGFVMKPGTGYTGPLWLAEFGMGTASFQGYANMKDVDSMFYDCLRTYLFNHDMDFGVWPLNGKYYVREGNFGYDETWGLLKYDGSEPRGPVFIQELQVLMKVRTEI
jgi:hypothetical protein